MLWTQQSTHLTSLSSLGRGVDRNQTTVNTSITHWVHVLCMCCTLRVINALAPQFNKHAIGWNKTLAWRQTTINSSMNSVILQCKRTAKTLQSFLSIPRHRLAPSPSMRDSQKIQVLHLCGLMPPWLYRRAFPYVKRCPGRRYCWHWKRAGLNPFFQTIRYQNWVRNCHGYRERAQHNQ